MTAASGKINLQKSKHDRTHVATASIAGVTSTMLFNTLPKRKLQRRHMPYFYVFNTRFESSASITQKGNIFSTK